MPRTTQESLPVQCLNALIELGSASCGVPYSILPTLLISVPPTPSTDPQTHSPHPALTAIVSPDPANEFALVHSRGQPCMFPPHSYDDTAAFVGVHTAKSRKIPVCTVLYASGLKHVPLALLYHCEADALLLGHAGWQRRPAGPPGRDVGEARCITVHDRQRDQIDSWDS
ncbi:hypothetical protein L210DRAFT_392724 [Boletus edulis BED1]|uniref:Uncharacterized protein n=1 Tax=Boletus edulis BED1 TaxID=1328754 RepID=A0AAD4BQ31_BOLED|nr:hypothetical protein L210DRAFT_392724 [Boletus edulis BED1]